MSDDLFKMAEKAGLIEETKPATWDDALRALEKNPGSKAQALAKKFRNKYNLNRSNNLEQERNNTMILNQEAVEEPKVPETGSTTESVGA